jgi:hypothetical protein
MMYMYKLSLQATQRNGVTYPRFATGNRLVNLSFWALSSGTSRTPTLQCYDMPHVGQLKISAEIP